MYSVLALPFGFWQPLPNISAMECVRLGLGAAEECLRGGKLDGPVLLANLKTIASGAKFVKLAKNDKHLSFSLPAKAGGPELFPTPLFSRISSLPATIS